MSAAHYTEQARNDLDEAWDWLAQRDEAAADALIDRIQGQATLHAQMPGMGRSRDELIPGVRSFVVYPYVVFFQPIPDGIIIVRVLHGKRDLESILKEDLAE